MPPEIIALIDNPLSLVAVLAVGSVIGIVVMRLGGDASRPKSGSSPYRQWSRGKPRPWKDKRTTESGTVTRLSPANATDQLNIVMGADFTVQPLLNKAEARLFKELDRMVIERHPDWQVMAQVSLGEILRCRDSAAYSCINSKRVDLLLVDGDCQARHAIEYQGSGHHAGNSAAARDAVKKEALRKAGIGYHEVAAGMVTPSDLRRLVEKLVPA